MTCAASVFFKKQMVRLGLYALYYYYYYMLLSSIQLVCLHLFMGVAGGTLLTITAVCSSQVKAHLVVNFFCFIRNAFNYSPNLLRYGEFVIPLTCAVGCFW